MLFAGYFLLAKFLLVEKGMSPCFIIIIINGMSPSFIIIIKRRAG
jgi:hypothetical protein